MYLRRFEMELEDTGREIATWSGPLEIIGSNSHEQ